MSTHRTVILEAHDGSQWRSLSELPTGKGSDLNKPLLWANPMLSPSPREAKDFPPLPDDCSERVQLRLKGVAYWVATCFDLPQFKAGIENAIRHTKNQAKSQAKDQNKSQAKDQAKSQAKNPLKEPTNSDSVQAMTEMKGAIAMAEVLTQGNIPVRFIIFLDH